MKSTSSVKHTGSGAFVSDPSDFHDAAGCVRAKHILVFYVDVWYNTTISHNVCILFLIASAKTAEYLKFVKFVAVYDCFIRGYPPMHKDCTVV